MGQKMNRWPLRHQRKLVVHLTSYKVLSPISMFLQRNGKPQRQMRVTLSNLQARERVNDVFCKRRLKLVMKMNSGFNHPACFYIFNLIIVSYLPFRSKAAVGRSSCPTFWEIISSAITEEIYK